MWRRPVAAAPKSTWDVDSAAGVVDPAFRESPQFVNDELCAALGRQVLVKVETLNPLGSDVPACRPPA